MKVIKIDSSWLKPESRDEPFMLCHANKMQSHDYKSFFLVIKLIAQSRWLTHILFLHN